MLLARPNIFMCYSVYLIFDLQWIPSSWKIKMSSLAPEHGINSGKLRFPIGLSTDWQSLIEPLCLNQAERLHLRPNSYFIFMFSFLLHWCHGIGDVFNMKRSPYGFNFCLVYVGISSVDNWTFNKNLSHLVLIGCDFHSLVLSNNLNRCGADWMYLLQV
jgi:hypothetical protein